LGAALGAALGLLGQAAVMLFGGAPMGGVAPSFVARLCGVLLTAAGYATILLTASLMTAPTVRWAAGRVLAAAVTTVLVTALVAGHVVGVVVRVLSGSFLTRGALEFFWNGQESAVRALKTTYATHLVAIVASGLVVACVGGAYLFKTLGRGGNAGRAVRQLKVAAVILSAFGLSLLALPVRTAMARSLGRTTPEIALLSSLTVAPAWSEEAEPGEAPAVAPRIVPEGPPRVFAAQWKKEVEERRGARPNVLLVVIDSLSTRHLGYFGYERPVTPNLDRIAARSMRLRRTWATATHSNYAQPAIVSSLFPRRVPWLDQYDRLDYPRVLLHDVFHLAGHATATISSQDQNWQGILKFERTSTPTYLWHAPDHDGPTVDIVSEKVVPDEVTAERAIAWMEAHKKEPFSLYVNFQIAHFPYSLPEGQAGAHSPAHMPATANFLGWDEADAPTMVNRYDNAVAYVDAQVGKIEGYLARTGQLDDTLWVITADHGEMLGEHRVFAHGTSLHEGEARVPLLVHFPRKVAAADVLVPVSHLDVLPTMLDLAGLPSHPAFQGHSFADPAAFAAKRTGIFFNTQGFRMTEGVVCFPWKLWIDRTGGALVRLYDLERDPGETKNLALDHPEISRSLSRMLAAQMRAQLDYHDVGSIAMRETRHAPRMLQCPDLPRKFAHEGEAR
jgi:arylsulfatase A-like enzyme